MGLRFYRGYNAASDPAWIYFMAADKRGRIYRIGGFDASDYSQLVQRWIGRTRMVNEQAATEIVSAYFKYVEQWRPGVVHSPRDARLLPTAKAQRCGSIYPRVHAERTRDKTTVSAVVFDEMTVGIECVQVELSQTRGLIVSSRIVISPRARTEM